MGVARGDVTVAIVSRSFAERYWPGETVISRVLRFDGEETSRHLVGTVEDVAASDVREMPEPTVYIPWAQQRIGWVQLNLRTRGTGQSILPLLRDELKALDPTLPLTQISTYGELRDGASRDARVLAGLATTLAGLAIVLAVVGLSGLVGFVMSRRRRELGIRAALGASPSANGGLVMRRAAAFDGDRASCRRCREPRRRHQSRGPALWRLPARPDAALDHRDDVGDSHAGRVLAACATGGSCRPGRRAAIRVESCATIERPEILPSCSPGHHYRTSRDVTQLVAPSSGRLSPLGQLGRGS